MIDNLLTLSHRLAALTGPNYAMDIEVMRALAPDLLISGEKGEYTQRAPTARVDDALLLIDLHFPECFFDAARGRETEDEPLFGCILFENAEDEIGVGESDANLAIAIVLALLDALICRPQPAATTLQ